MAYNFNKLVGMFEMTDRIRTLKEIIVMYKRKIARLDNVREKLHWMKCEKLDEWLAKRRDKACLYLSRAKEMLVREEQAHTALYISRERYMDKKLRKNN